MNNKKLVSVMVAVGLVASGCASSPDKISAQSVSTLPYEQHNCVQVSAELDRVSRRAGELHGRLDKTASADNAQMAIGMLLFWPALFFLEGGDGPEAAEYARLKGERDALEKVAIQKQCGLSVQKAEEQPKQAEQTTAVN